MPRCAAFGEQSDIADGMAEFIDKHGAQELILVSSVFDHKARLRSYEITMAAAQDLQTSPATS